MMNEAQAKASQSDLQERQQLALAKIEAAALRR